MHLEDIVGGHGGCAGGDALADVGDQAFVGEANVGRIGDRQFAVVDLDGDDGDRVAAAARAVEVDEEETIALLSSGLYGVKSFTLDTYQDTVQSRDERIRERLLPSGLTLAPRPVEPEPAEAEDPTAAPPLGAERVDARQPVIATAPESYNRLVETLRIRAERAGTVEAICVASGEEVEAGQILMRIG